ncbi:hypothetical protein EJ05DRAFT_511380 [Pseudovirgaria hyperparasitica]|uniref:Uncharacterized protein n=1 Tax=Pseudovirgaria hyperparasitica TaxID=470096 RepID=A0A6A6W411_9PEZI|nr:uncharacterized protein EJ05DRAFT_511380 [Pseudovirgaria hyperparasitica]KAF2757592.1 hypothetical protein EJ05DRAFT_511380 [Pseudovirgaria hyperparasitica]
MSRPWQFAQDHRSPLDRRQQGPPGGPPPSFSTNVNRAKTKKWVEAKSFSYDGDDWGEYDEQDEYGASAAPPPVPQQQQMPSNAARNFTDPRSAPSQAMGRKNSFDTGDERRAFSGPHPPQHRIDTSGPANNLRHEESLMQSPASMASASGPASQQQYTRSGQQQSYPSQPAASRQSSAASWSHSVISETPSANMEPQRRQDYNPSAMPQPLQTRPSVGPGESPVSKFPPRKSSLGQDDAPSDLLGSLDATPTALKQRTGSESSGTPNLIRPADIYKRIAEAREKERASMESSRPSVDSLSSRPAEDSSRSARPLESVAEGKSENIAQPPATSGAPQIQAPPATSTTTPAKRFSNSPALPEFSSTSFGDDFWSQAGYSPGPATPPVQRQLSRKQPASSSNNTSSEIKGVVDQAFTRKDDNSVPPTPVSRQPGSTSETGSSVSRSNTDSTSGISPIMSRVPSSAAAASRARVAEAKDMATPVIAEESPNASRRASATLHGLDQAPLRPDQATHSRTGSGGSNPKRRSLVSPTPTDSPARSPVIASTAHLRFPSAAEIDVASPVGASTSEIPSPTKDYTMREEDIAQAIVTSPERDVAKLAGQEKESQAAFLEQTREFTAPNPAIPRDRSESPSKGRVRDLAGKFDAESRRNSVQSVSSNKSAKQDTTVHSTDARPAPAREESFRPKLPGQWESYVSTPGLATPSEPEKQLQNAPEDKHDANAVDLEATSPKWTETPEGNVTSPSDAMSALAAAGAAMGESIKAAAGFGSSEETPKSRDIGEVQSRPLGPQRIESNLTESTIAPTPPPKDIDDESQSESSNEIRPVPPLKSREATPVPDMLPPISTAEQSVSVPRLSTDNSPNDEESDRLRKEIVQTLSPIASESPQAAKLAQKLAAPEAALSRDSSVLPAEYDSFWGGPGGADTYPFRNVTSKPTSPETTVEAPVVEKAVELDASTGPGYLDRRFSWEKPAPKPSGSAPIALPTETSPAAPIPTSTNSPLPPPPANIAASDVSTPDTTGPVVNRGLHVLNTENPEAIEEPTYGRPSAEMSKVSSLQQDEPIEPTVEAQQPSFSGPPASAAAVADPGRIPPFREILVLKSAHERTEKYDLTRKQFADMDTGLRNWLEITLAARPEHADVRNIAIRAPNVPAAVPSSARHRHAPSLSVFSKMNQVATSSKPSFSHQPSTNSPSSPAVAAGSPVSAAHTGTSSPSGGAKVQAKGKELLQTAGIFGGKATTSARGLFAKGKSRLKGGGEKVVD